MRTALAAVLTCSIAPGAVAAQKLVATVPGTTFNVGGTPVTRTLTFNAPEPITGVGFTALWTAVVADEEDGIAPWSLDLSLVVTAPGGQVSPEWHPLGGDRTIADYPLQDATGGMFAGVSGQGDFQFRFESFGPPWVAGLVDPQFHLLTQAPDVVEVASGSTESGPMWSRPFYIAGVSGLGPVVYQARPFRVSVSGLYTFHSVVSSGNNFTFLYQDGFDAAAPLDNLLDYGLGNGSAPNGAPQGTSLIEALLFEGRDYWFVNSQWDRFSAGTPYTNTITGPGALLEQTDCAGDTNGDGLVNFTDLNNVLADFGMSGMDLLGDLDGDGDVDFTDLNELLSAFGDDCTGV